MPGTRSGGPANTNTKDACVTPSAGGKTAGAGGGQSRDVSMMERDLVTPVSGGAVQVNRQTSDFVVNPPAAAGSGPAGSDPDHLSTVKSEDLSDRDPGSSVRPIKRQRRLSDGVHKNLRADVDVEAVQVRP